MSTRGIISSFASPFLRSKPMPAMSEYDTYDRALESSDSYEDPRLTNVVLEKTNRYRQKLAEQKLRVIASRQMSQNLFVLSYVDPARAINILEVGGACGAGYFEMQQLLPDRVCHWAVVETPRMVTAAQQLAHDPKLSFYTDIKDAAASLNSRDLAVAQGVLQYARNPLEMLADLFSLRFNYVHVSRTVVLSGESPTQIFTRQTTQLSAHGPGPFPPGMTDGTSTQPMVLINRQSILAAVPSTYKILFLFEESEHDVVIGGQTRRLAEIGLLAHLCN
jgi:putative methyltransferase (TIGR04325 family)